MNSGPAFKTILLSASRSLLASSFAISVLHADEPIPLPEAAREFALPAGGLVVADAAAREAEYAAVGNLGIEEFPPEALLFEIGSITKVFTGVLLGQAVAEGKVTLETTVGSLLGGEFSDPRVAGITLRELATHSSGLPRLPENLEAGADSENPYAHYDEARLLRGVRAEALEEPPYPTSYSNYGVGLLGYLLAGAYGGSWEEVITEKVIVPLGLSETVVEPGESLNGRLVTGHAGDKEVPGWDLNVLAGAGALHSTAGDLVKFGRALINPDSTPLADALRMVATPQNDAKDVGLCIRILEVDGTKVWQHSGGTGGYSSTLRVIPAENRVQVVLANQSEFGGAMVLNRARGETARTEESGRKLTASDVVEYAGIYPLGEQAMFTVAPDGDRLWVRLSGQPFFQLFPHEEADRFFLKVVPAEVKFERSGGRIKAMVLHQNGVEQRAKLSDQKVPSYRFPSRKELEEFAGVYLLGPAAVFDLEVRGRTLVARLTGQSFHPVFQTKDDWFEYEVVPAALEFERDEEGEIIALKLHQNGAIQRAVRR